MKINNITIKNFRGFQEKYFEFDPNMNVVLGDNTTGKTTLLHAVQIALGGYFQALTILPKTNGFGRNFKKTDIPMFMSEANRSFLPLESKPNISIDADFYSLSYDYNSNRIINNGTNRVFWTRNNNQFSRSNYGALLNSLIPMEDERFHADKAQTNSIFPLFLAFGSTRLERNSYLTPKKSKRFEVRLENAYKSALDDRNIDFKSASNWIYNYTFNLERGFEFVGTRDAFLETLMIAIPAIKDVHIDGRNGEFFLYIRMAKDKRTHCLTYDILSDGFKSMINIVSDIAYRCIMLNGFLGKDAVKETPGVVMIDEVDLFLHPHWQQHVLADLQAAFPKIQFIVTTHSPFIVQSVESKNVITLDGEKGDSNPTMRSIEDIAVTEMNMDSARFPKYNLMLEKAEEYFQLVKSGKENEQETQKVKQELDEIEELFSSDPAYVALLRAERRSK